MVLFWSNKKGGWINICKKQYGFTFCRTKYITKKIKLVDDKEKVIGLKNNIDLLQRQIKDRIISNIEPSVLGLFDIKVLEEDNKKI